MPTVLVGDNTGDDYSGTEDFYMNAAAATTNYGTAANLQFFDGTLGSNDRTIMFAFSGISSIPVGATFSSTTLYIYKSDLDAGTTTTARFQRCLRNWVEAEATYTVYSTGNNWTSGGGQSNGNDRSATTTLDISLTGSIQYYSNSSAQLTQDVQDFYDGTFANYGWIVEAIDVSGAPFHNIISSDGTDGQRPYLSATYTAGVTIPVFVNHYKNQGIM